MMIVVVLQGMLLSALDALLDFLSLLSPGSVACLKRDSVSLVVAFIVEK